MLPRVSAHDIYLPREKWGLCVFVSGRGPRAGPGRAPWCVEAPGREGAGSRAQGAVPATSGHSAEVEGLRKGAWRAGGASP